MNRQNLIQRLVARKLQSATSAKVICVCIAAGRQALCFNATSRQALCFGAAKPKK